MPRERIDRAILVIRRHRVMLVNDLAGLYGVETRAVVQAVQRQPKPLPGGLHVPADEGGV